MKALTTALCLCLTLANSDAKELDARAAFGSVPGRSLDAAKKRATQDHKRIFLVAYDPRGDYNDQGLQIKYFTDFEETKKLIKDHFIVVLLPVDHKDVSAIAGSVNMERPRFFLLSAAGSKIKDDSMAKNPADGLRIVKELIALP